MVVVREAILGEGTRNTLTTLCEEEGEKNEGSREKEEEEGDGREGRKMENATQENEGRLRSEDIGESSIGNK